MNHVLITGFEAFDGQTINPSEEAVRRLDGRVVEGRLVVGRVLPCAFGRSAEALRAELEELDPELVVCVGQAGGRAAISIERVAINVDDARIPDNLGEQPVDVAIEPDGPAAHWSSLPIKAIVEELQRADLPAAVSQTAGTFVCNHVFYALMSALRSRGRGRGGFIHVPFQHEQVADSGSDAPSLSLDDIVRGLELAIHAALTHDHDVQLPGGATH